MNEPSDPTASTDELPDPYDDEELLAVIRFFENSGRDLVEAFGSAMREGIDAIIDTASTGRWNLEDCADVEKTYLGYKIEKLKSEQKRIGRQKAEAEAELAKATVERDDVLKKVRSALKFAEDPVLCQRPCWRPTNDESNDV